MSANQHPEMTLNLTEPSPADRVLEIPAELSLSLGHALVCVSGIDRVCVAAATTS